MNKYTFKDIEELRDRSKALRLSTIKACHPQADEDWLSMSLVEEDVRTHMLAGLYAHDLPEVVTDDSLNT